MFDSRKLVFVPKAPSSSNATGWVVHTMVYSTDLLALYHNLQLHNISGIPREYLFARFAWTLFPEIERFLVGDVEQLLVSAREAFVASAEPCQASSTDRRAGL